MVRAIVNIGDQFETVTDHSQISDWLTQPKATLWVDILDPDNEAIHLLRDEFGFHALSLEDVVRQHQRPKIDIYPEYYFVVFYALAYPSEEASLKTDEIHIFLGSNFVVTTHEGDLPELDEVWSRWQRHSDVVGADIGSLLYEILDRIVDDYFPVVDTIAERVEALETRIFESFDKAALSDIFSLKKDLLTLRRIVAPERDVLNVLLRRDPPILPATSMIFFQDIYDHCLRVLDSVDTYRDLLTSALDGYLSIQSNNLNEVMRRLTVISTIFLPLTFLTGFFGMNFEGLPFANGLVFWGALLVMLLTPLLMLLYFRWRGLDRD